MPKVEQEFLALVRVTYAGEIDVALQACPPWLKRPGRVEARDQWGLACDVYESLTGLMLPEVMPSNEWRKLDAVLTYRDGAQRVLEVDEEQHFTTERLATLDLYSDHLSVAFDIGVWRERCRSLGHKKRGGGWSKPKPPLFPGEGGRNRQRAFRDFLADVIPSAHGWLPTIRILDVEASAVLDADNVVKTLSEVLDR